MDPVTQFLLMQAIGRPTQATRPTQVEWPTANDFGINGPEQPPPPQDPQRLLAEDYIASNDPNKPRPPATRMEGFRRLLTDWTYSLGSGLTAASAGAPGRANRTAAGIGAILQAPEVLRQARERQQQLQDARDQDVLKNVLEYKRLTGIEGNYASLERDRLARDQNTDLKRLEDERKAEAAAKLRQQYNNIMLADKGLMQDDSGMIVAKKTQDLTPEQQAEIKLKEARAEELKKLKLTDDKVQVDGKNAEVLKDKYGNYYDINTKQPITGRITPYIDLPTPRDRGDITPASEATLINQLNRQWNAASADVRELYRANTIMKSGMDAARRGDMNAGAQAVLVVFQKFLDPTSVVRESEYARSGQGQSMANRVRGWIETQVIGGANMTLAELETFQKAAQEISDNLNKEGESLLSAERQRISAVANRFKIPVELVIPSYDYSIPGGGMPPPAGTAPPPRPAAGTPPAPGAATPAVGKKPASMAQETWDAMTPQQKALFK